MPEVEIVVAAVVEAGAGTVTDTVYGTRTVTGTGIVTGTVTGAGAATVGAGAAGFCKNEPSNAEA